MKKLPPLLGWKGDKPVCGLLLQKKKVSHGCHRLWTGLTTDRLHTLPYLCVEGRLQNLEGQKGYSYPKAGGWQRRNVKGINIYGSLLHPCTLLTLCLVIPVRKEFIISVLKATFTCVCMSVCKACTYGNSVPLSMCSVRIYGMNFLGV